MHDERSERRELSWDACKLHGLQIPLEHLFNDALELLRLCVSECAPGVQPEHHVIGSSGLDETIPPDMRPTAPIGVVRAACSYR